MGARAWLMVAAVALGLTVGLVPGEADAAKRGKSKVELSGVINLNEATVEQLDLLPGVGEKAAERIIHYRKKRPFKRAAELVRVKGFGRKKFAKLKEHLAVTGPTTLTSRRVKVESEKPDTAKSQGEGEGEVASNPPPADEAKARLRAQARAMTRIKR